MTGGNLYPGGKKYVVDENGDPIKSRLGNTIPSTTGGFGFDGRVGNFDFNIFFNYSLGNKIVNGTKIANSFFTGSSRNYNLIADFNVNNRYTWIDPETGLNLGRVNINGCRIRWGRSRYGTFERNQCRSEHLQSCSSNANVFQ